MKIKSYFDEHEDVNILNTQYVKSYKDEMTGKWSDDVLYITYRDNTTGEKRMKEIINPEVTTFITKLEHRSDFKTQRLYLPESDVDNHNIRYNQITKYIANEIKKDGRDLDFLKITSEAPKEVFKWRHSYFADYDICDYAMIAHAISNLHNGSVTNTNITTAYLDIESDIYGLSTTEVNNGDAPMNAVSVVMPYDDKGNKLKHPRVFTLLLRDHLRYKHQEYFETHIDEFIKECHDEFDKKYNKPNFIIRLYDDEIVLFKNLFALLHKMRPDFILIWNMSYDIPTMITRLNAMGENPVNYFCHPDFSHPYYRYNYDHVYKNDFKNKSESFECTCYSAFSDQMLNYAGIRKSKREYGGNSLDNVAHIELKSEKRRFDNPTTNVTNAAREEYWNFVKYSINDVLLQYGIDKKTEDTKTLFEQAVYGGTRIHKALKQSVYLKNVFAIEYLLEGIVPRNNNNVNYTKYKNEDQALDNESNINILDPDNISLGGALVGDPTLNSHTGMVLYKSKYHSIMKLESPEKSNHLYEYVIDFDFKSMYPNLKIAGNFGENTQIGRIIIDKKIIPSENPLNESKFMRGGKFIEDFETNDPSLIGTWLQLPSAYDIINDYDEMYHNTSTGNNTNDLERDENGRIIIHSRSLNYNDYALVNAIIDEMSNL